MNCSAVISEHTKFCPSCGTDQKNQQQTPFVNQNLTGYSSRINDPQIAAALKKNIKAGMGFTLILAVVMVLGFTGAGAAEVGGLELPSALYMGIGLGAILFVIAIFQMIKAKNDKTWDGVIVDKTIKKPSHADRQGGNYQTRYFIHLQLDNGKKKTIPSTTELFNYYQTGERVRHHAGTADHIPEKYDKSRDASIYCVVCSSRNDISDDRCHRCKSPLLK
jgi:hypothetical protein